MRTYRLYLGLTVVTLLAWGCDENMEFPPEPTVAFERMRWQPGDGPTDSLQLSFVFKDGDGDLGLAEDDVDAPYHPFDLVVDENNQLVTISNEVSLPLYTLAPDGVRSPYAEEDIRTAYSDLNYLLVDSSATAGLSADTLFVRRNVFHNNIYLRCFKKNNGSYIPFDGFCQDGQGQIAGRFGRISEEMKEPPPVGRIRYSFAAPNFLKAVRADTLKFQFYIFDRELNQSNLATSPDLTVVDMIASGS